MACNVEEVLKLYDSSNHNILFAMMMILLWLQLNNTIIFPLLAQNKLSEQHTVNESTTVKYISRNEKSIIAFSCDSNNIISK